MLSRSVLGGVVCLTLVIGCGDLPPLPREKSADGAASVDSFAAGVDSFAAGVDSVAAGETRPTDGPASPSPDTALPSAVDGNAGGSDAARDVHTVEPRDSALEAVNTCGPDGAECLSTSDPCKVAGTCKAGVCGAISNAPDNKKCGAASDACHTDRVCKAGVCQAEGSRLEGYNYDSTNYLARCCGGAPTSINTASNCGACGLRCASGKCINTGATNSQQWWCTCSGNSECFSNCCADGSPSVCSPSSCGSTAKCTSCPGGASCTAEQNPHYWCHY